jgi:hypothetical protein
MDVLSELETALQELDSVIDRCNEARKLAPEGRAKAALDAAMWDAKSVKNHLDRVARAIANS